MTGWDISRHPEWDMMYAAGLTVREIADRCHANVATVHMHLRVREKYAPGLHATHAAALAERDPDRPSTRWRQRLTEVLAFQETYHRLPSNTAEGVECLLAQWVALQRNAYRKGGMSAAKMVLLDQLDGWKVDVQQQRRDEHWRNMLNAVAAFVSSTGQMPRYKTYASEHEHRLGVWLHRQHQARTENTLLSWRQAALDELVPAWRSRC